MKEFDVMQIDFDGSQDTNEEWKRIMASELSKSKRFEIHCWNDETMFIDLALQFGKLKNSGWEYGKIIVGEVTTDFTEIVLNYPKPTDTEIYNKMTPFFSIFLDNGFSSEHYGTELNKEI